MLRMFWFHFRFKGKTDVALRWQWGLFGIKANARPSYIAIHICFMFMMAKQSIQTLEILVICNGILYPLCFILMHYLDIENMCKSKVIYVNNF